MRLMRQMNNNMLTFNLKYRVVMSLATSQNPGTGDTMIQDTLLWSILKLLVYKNKCNVEEANRVNGNVLDCEVLLAKTLGYDLLEWSESCAQMGDEKLSIALFESFSPKMSVPSNNWLTSGDIGDFMKMVEKLPNIKFGFYGPFPIDYNFKPSKMPRDVSSIGVVINTGSGKGSHWVALFMDLKTENVEYFDSLGNEPSESMVIMIENIVSATASNYKFLSKQDDCVVRCSSVRFQHNDTDCGVYCVKFLLERATNLCKNICLLSTDTYNDHTCKILRKTWWN